ncbi:imidazole glycerol phosphate synthase subunit HisH [Agriterribacter sp.]|uniref:imidazole glycerol phosphate synthase subunit HisH n=1 Tax=Agriterribacter sp. TaxID=2821509 RepID=UPI002C309657|nr:imidazole glycerol phosphate synthase subunit HisH [Agriterribacter sp.]HTN06106.1 imidazole glycerol phosphate synthase subunit HisH [Agriterribacter sp.]
MILTIIDYGVGNLSSIKNMLKKIGVDSIISNKTDDLINADKLILPGVGHFDYGIQHLHESGLMDPLNDKVLQHKTPILGICLGVQLLTQSSEEGKEKGLGWIKGRTVAFDKPKLDGNHKIPHMGWIDIKGFENSKLFTGMYDEPRFYFVHSYHLQLDNPADVLATANYGYNFAIGIEHENILGVQFHPEKSHKYGMKLLENFVKYY